jgi:hypothetical protein
MPLDFFIERWKNIMFDMNQINKRYWDVKFTNGLFLSVECPKLKTLRKITELTKSKENAIESLAEALSMALSKNKQGKTITSDFIEENFNIDDINNILLNYIDWVKNVKNSPN